MYVVGPKNIQKVLQDTKIMDGLGQNPTRNLNPSNSIKKLNKPTKPEQTRNTWTNPTQGQKKPKPDPPITKLSLWENLTSHLF